MNHENTINVRALARAHLWIDKYKIPFDGEGEDLRGRQHLSLKKQIDHQPPYLLQEAWAAEGRLGLCPEFFVAEMKMHWVDTLGNVVTAKLEKLWRSMAKTFNRLLLAKKGDPWLILSPETGTGKTQGSAVYAALSALYTTTGILFTTRLTSQCDGVVRDINEIAERHCSRYQKGGRFGVLSGSLAVTIHSDQEKEPTESVIFNTPCLIITHERMKRIYKENLEHGSNNSDRALEKFNTITRWRGGLRIRITDETPSNLIEHFRLTPYTFADLLSVLRSQEMTGKLSEEAKEQLQLVGCIEQACYQFWKALEETDDHSGAKVITLGDFLPTDHGFQTFTLDALFRAVRGAGDHSQADIDKRKEKALGSLLALQHVALSWAVAMSNVESQKIVTSAWLITPPDNMPMAVLDATASTTPLWKVLETKVEHVAIERDIRDYRNVTANLCYLKTGGVGKSATKKDIKVRLDRVFEYFEAEGLEEDDKRRVLICLPMAAKNSTKELATKEDGVTVKDTPPYLKDLKVAHWGAIDGRNDFNDCDTVVILSWQYPPANLPIDLLFASTDPSNRTDSFLKETKSLRKELELGHVGASVIQAVNRVRCRNVTSEDGSCENTDIFMVMPKATNRDAMTMRDTLEREMPHMVFRDWDISLTTKPQQPKVRSGSQADRLLDYLSNLQSSVDSIVVSEALEQLGVPPKTQERLRSQMNDTGSTLSNTLSSLGWTYSRQGNGRGAMTILMRTKGETLS